MHTLEPILAKHPFFEGLDKRYLELLTGCASNVVFKPDTLVFREGEDAKQFFILREGAVAIEIFAPGQGNVTIQTVEEGDIVGWSWLFPPHRWMFSGRVLQPVRAIALDGECLRKKCEEDHSLGYEFFKRFSHLLVERLQATRLQLLDLYSIH
ncbi:MAG: cyclic nucleotide-binding domain-containing protein [Anaerolineae bacterium]|nr:cyclic nucleotide-binding domain-containing protein [Anaerolineae bacterium]